MPFTFETHVLPLLREMADDPLADGYPLRERAMELGLAHDRREAERLLELIRDGGHISFRGKKLANGTWGVVYDIRLTSRGLAAVGVWPGEEDGVVYLLQRVSDALADRADELEAEDADPEVVGRLRSGGRVLREFAVDVTARVIAHKIDG